jgi:hypothetical protein
MKHKYWFALMLASLGFLALGCPAPVEPQDPEPESIPAPVSITLLAIPSVSLPVTGQSPVANLDTVQYTGTVFWSPSVEGIFAAKTSYSATITLTPKPGYSLSGVAADSFTVDGAASVSHSADSDVITAVFPSTATFAKRIGGSSSDQGYALCRDSGGNLVASGIVNGSSDLNSDGDSSDGSTETGAGYGSNDIFMVKWDSAGTLQWVKRLGGANGDCGFSVCADSNRNIFITGYISGAADLNGDGDSTDGGPESAAGYGSEDIVIAKFDPDGNLQWAKRLGGTSIDSGYSVACDSGGNVLVTGWVSGAADLNGDGDRTDGSAETGTGYGNYDVFVAKFGPDGSFQWAKRLGGTSADLGSSVAVDSTGNVAAIGRVTGAADLNGDGDSADGEPESATGLGNSDIYISKFSADGTFLWSKRLGGTSADFGNSIAFDSGGNIIASGWVYGAADFNGDRDFMDGITEQGGGFGNFDIFVAKFDPDGNFQWAKRLGGISSDNGQCVSLDSLGNVLVAGSVYGAADLNEDGDTEDGIQETGAGFGSADMLIVKLGSDGSFLWAKRLGGSGSDSGYSVACDTAGNVLVCGYVTGAADLNADGDSADGAPESAAGFALFDIILVKFSPNGVAQ